VAEVIVGELARRLGIRVPELKTIEVDEAIGLREPDPGIQQLLVASAGLNLAVDFLPGSLWLGRELVPPGPAAGRPDPVARCPRCQRRPDLAQPEPAALAPSALGDRPWGRPVLPPRLDHAGALQHAAVRRERSHPPAGGGRDRGRRRQPRPARHRGPARRGGRPRARCVAGAGHRTPVRGRDPDGLRRVPARPAGAPHIWLPAAAA